MLIETKLRLLVHLLFLFLVPVSIEAQSQLLPSINTPLNPLTYRNLTKSISPSLTTSTTYSNTQRSNQHHQTSCRQLRYHDRTFLFAFICKLGTVGSLLIHQTKNLIHMKTNIISTLKDGYSIAKNPAQLAKVKRWHNKVSKTVANCHTLLDECDRLDQEFDKVARRMGLK